MESDKPWEVLIEILVRLGIITAHAFDLVGGWNTVRLVMVLWMIEEMVSVMIDRRKLRRQK